MNARSHDTVPIRVEIDSLPEKLFENARDWSDLAVTRLLAQPLFEEAPNRGLRSDLISNCQRLSESSWRITLSEKARWNSGARISSEDVCRQIMRARQAKAAPLSVSLMIKSMKVEAPDAINFETRIPIAHLDRVLANPGLAPRSIDSFTSGAFSLRTQSVDRLNLVSSRCGRPLDLICFPRKDNVDPFDAEKVDVSGPISISPQHWPTASSSKTAQVFALDIVYALILPRWLSALNRRELHSAFDRRRICEIGNGFVSPCYYMTDLWTKGKIHFSETPQRPISPWKIPGKVHLFYTAFPGNFEITKAVADEFFEKLQCNVSIAPCEYSQFISASSDEYENAFRLALIASLWPHPIGMLAPFFFGAGSPRLFKDAFIEAAKVDDLTTAAEYAAVAEKILIEEGSRIITLGRVNGCMRSRINHLWCPPSGWIDYSQLYNI